MAMAAVAEANTSVLDATAPLQCQRRNFMLPDVSSTTGSSPTLTAWAIACEACRTESLSLLSTTLFRGRYQVIHFYLKETHRFASGVPWVWEQSVREGEWRWGPFSGPPTCPCAILALHGGAVGRSLIQHLLRQAILIGPLQRHPSRWSPETCSFGVCDSLEAREGSALASISPCQTVPSKLGRQESAPTSVLL